MPWHRYDHKRPGARNVRELIQQLEALAAEHGDDVQVRAFNDIEDYDLAFAAWDDEGDEERFQDGSGIPPHIVIVGQRSDPRDRHPRPGGLRSHGRRGR